MAHSFESSRPEHQILEMSIPEGHYQADQKYGKGMRSPMIGQLPTETGLESHETRVSGTGMGSSQGE